jgi:hypothetical protein
MGKLLGNLLCELLDGGLVNINSALRAILNQILALLNNCREANLQCSVLQLAMKWSGVLQEIYVRSRLQSKFRTLARPSLGRNAAVRRSSEKKFLGVSSRKESCQRIKTKTIKPRVRKTNAARVRKSNAGKVNKTNAAKVRTLKPAKVSKDKRAKVGTPQKSNCLG